MVRNNTLSYLDRERLKTLENIPDLMSTFEYDGEHPLIAHFHADISKEYNKKMCYDSVNAAH